MSERIFKDSKELYDDLSKKTKKAHTETANRLIKELHRIEDEEVYSQPALSYVMDSDGSNNSTFKYLMYGFGGGLGSYERTYDLYDVIGLYKVGSNQYKSVFEIKPIKGRLSHDCVYYQHDNPYSYPLSEEAYLNIIEEGLSPEKSMFGRIFARPFWDEFLDYCNENYEIIFAEEFEKL